MDRYASPPNPLLTARPRAVAPSGLLARLAWPRAWSYAASAAAAGKRDLRLDLLRGFAVFAMIVDHIGGESSWLYAITGGDRFFVSAAEIFVVLSGLTMGMVYRGVLARGGARAVLAKATRRALLLYALTVSLTLATATVALAFQLPWAPAVAPETAAAFAWSVLTLQHAYYLTDVLLLYTLLVLVAGPVLVLLAQRRARLVLAASWSLWLLWQLNLGHTRLFWPSLDGMAFPFAAWQVYFFTALVVGFHRRALAERLRQLSPARALAISGVLAAGLLALHRYLTAASATVAQTHLTWLLSELFYKYDVRVGRIVAVLIFVVAAYSLLTLAWAPLRRGLGWLWLPLGQHALTGYALHLFIVPLALLARWTFRPEGVAGAAENTLAQLTGVLAVWAVVVARQRVSAWRRAVTARPGQPARAARPGPGVHGGLRVSLGTLGVAASVVAMLGAARLWPSVAVGAEATDVPAAAVDMPLGGSVQSIQAPAADATSRVERGVLQSVALGREMPYTVYLPPGYNPAGTDRYPALYMLHGMGGHNTEWEQYGLLETADRLISAGEIAPLIIVLPQGDQSYWVDWADGGPAWGRYLAHDVVQHVDASVRTLADPSHRAVGGLSMGAHGALQVAFSYPGVFGVVGAHSPALRSFPERLPYFGNRAYFNAHDPVHLVYRHPEVARPLQLWLDVGEDDPWHGRATHLQAALERSEVRHIWQVYPGGHDGAYWSAHVADYLRFYARTLAPEAVDGPWFQA